MLQVFLRKSLIVSVEYGLHFLNFPMQILKVLDSMICYLLFNEKFKYFRGESQENNLGYFKKMF